MALNEGEMGASNGRAERDPRIERLYRETRREEPPARLDAAILAAARREVGAGPRSLASKLRRWHVPVSIAAVVMVSVTLVILMEEEEGKRNGLPPVRAVPAEVAQESMERQIAATPSPPRESRDDKKPVSKSEVALSSRPEPGLPAAAGTGTAGTPAGKKVQEPSLAAPLHAEEERVQADLATGGRLASTPAAPGEPRAARPRVEARRSAPVAGAIAMKSVEQDRPPVWEGLEKAPPEKWLARIEELKAQGRGPEVEEMLAEFKRRFPEHPLPPGLK